MLQPNNDRKVNSLNFSKFVFVSKRFVQDYNIVLGLIFLSILFSLLSSKFLTINNLLNIFVQTTDNTIPAMGEALVIITGGIDLSVGANIGAGSVIYTVLSNIGLHPSIAILAVVIGGALLGSVNGLIVTQLKINPFIATLATMSLVKGATALLTGGTIITASGARILENPAVFQIIGRGKLIGMPIEIVILIFVIFIFWFLLSKTKLGTYFIAVGGGINASRIAGIAIEKVIFSAYMISGICSCFTGAIYASRMMSGQFTVGAGLEIIIIAGCVIGGVSLSGGKGKPLFVFFGVLVLTMITNILNILNVPWYFHLTIQGSVVWLIVYLETLTNRQRMER